MDYPVTVQVLDSLRKLVGDFPHSVFSEVEIPFLEVVEQICTSHVLQYNKVVIRVFKHFDQLYNVWVLAHFQNFYFSSLLKSLNVRHALLLYLLDCEFASSNCIISFSNQSELSLSERFPKSVGL